MQVSMHGSYCVPGKSYSLKKITESADACCIFTEAFGKELIINKLMGISKIGGRNFALKVIIAGTDLK